MNCFLACTRASILAILRQIAYLKLRRNTLEIPVDVTVESKKEWTAPELKKVDVEEITANSNGGGADLFNPS
jgi:hypothetical protein